MPVTLGGLNPSGGRDCLIRRRGETSPAGAVRIDFADTGHALSWLRRRVDGCRLMVPLRGLLADVEWGWQPRLPDQDILRRLAQLLAEGRLVAEEVSRRCERPVAPVRVPGSSAGAVSPAPAASGAAASASPTAAGAPAGSDEDTAEGDTFPPDTDAAALASALRRASSSGAATVEICKC
ncbi:MAG TPA: hypothetical protein VK943_15325 [Arenibaculum sp.]|nr:hypothetical protein [Arenibaculum sp.]